MKLASKIWLILGFLCSLIAYSFFDYLWEGAWYQLTAFSFVGYTRVIYNESRGVWSLISFIIWLLTLNAFFDELFFNPTKVEINEYIGTIITIFIAIKHKKRWIK